MECMRMQRTRLQLVETCARPMKLSTNTSVTESGQLAVGRHGSLDGGTGTAPIAPGTKTLVVLRGLFHVTLRDRLRRREPRPGRAEGRRTGGALGGLSISPGLMRCTMSSRG